MVPVPQNNGEFGIIGMDLLWRVNNKGSAETINILTLFGVVSAMRLDSATELITSIPMRGHEPNMSPIDLMSLRG
jgi:predicted RNase H-like nuclease